MAFAQVLVVDDDPDVRHLAVMALQMRPGVTVHHAGSAEAGLQILETLTPDVVVLDVMMPGMDGPGMLERMQAHDRLRHVPVVFLTAMAQRHQVKQLQTTAAVGVLTKPFDPLGLADDIEQLLAKA